MSWKNSEMARECAQLLEANDVVVLGRGLPALIRGQLEGEPITVIDEIGIVGAGPDARSRHRSGQMDSNGAEVAIATGGAMLGPLEVAGLLRRGWVDAGIIEPVSLDAAGSVRLNGVDGGPSFPLGLEAEILAGAGRLLAICRLNGGNVANFLLPANAKTEKVVAHRPIELVVTDLGILRPNGEAFEVVQLANSVTFEQIRSAIEAPVVETSDWSKAAAGQPADDAITTK